MKDGVDGVDGLDGATSVILSRTEITPMSRVNGRCCELVREKREHGSLDLRRSVEGRSGWSGRLGWCQWVILSSDGNHAYVTGPDGDDAVSWYERNASTGALTYGGFVEGRSGWSGRLEWCQNCDPVIGRKSRVCHGKNDNAVSWYERNASTGALTYGGVEGRSGRSGRLEWCQNLTLSSDGKHAYVTGSSDDAVSWYERNASTGSLTYGGILKDAVDGVDGLSGANSVTLSSDGNHAYVTGLHDNAVSWYERNASTGALTYGGILK